MLDSLKQSAGAAARNTAIGLLGATLALVGVGFLTAALWMELSQAHGAPVAATIIGSLYITFGTIIFAISHLRWGQGTSASVKQGQSPAQTPMQSVVLAFMQGLDAAIIAKRGGSFRGF